MGSVLLLLAGCRHTAPPSGPTFIESPQESLTKVVGFLGETMPDAKRIASCIEAQGVARKNDYRNFKFYGADYFRLLKG